MHHLRQALVVILLSGSLATVDAAENSLTLRNTGASAAANHPMQIGRPFVPGEIAAYPQALVDGSAVLTQADVKTRWPDGSVKHAILSFLVPSVPAGSTTTVTFRSQSSGNNGGSLTPAQMLGTNVDFEARMELTNGGTTVTASGRAMLQAGAVTYWLQGPVATSVILADHSAARAFDVGFDAHRSFRPIIHATFWPALDKVRVRFIGEIANTQALQDQVYALVLKVGLASPASVYSKASFTHTAESRWTKEFWIGGAPPSLHVDHNLAYLRETRLVPNYDTRKSPSATAIGNAYTAWTNAARDLYAAGNWTKYMPATGGRDEIGPYPQWVVHWLYTGDDRMREKALGNADLAAAWPMHFREGSTGRFYDVADTVDALGLPVSINGRPTVRVTSLATGDTTAGDRITPVGTRTNDGWSPDGAHQPDPFSVPYMLTGDYFYLEELDFWAAWGAASFHPGTTVHYGRGPSGSSGAISGQVREQGWVLRNRVHAAAMSPDAGPAKSYYEILTRNALAIWEGQRNVTGTAFEGGTLWNWGRTTGNGVWSGYDPPVAIPFWAVGSAALTQSPVDPSVASAADSPWMQNMVIWSLGRAQELGYPSDALLAWVAPVLIGQIIDPAYDPKMIAAYRVPTVSLTTGAYFSDWAGVRAGFLDSWDYTAGFTSSLTQSHHGYAFIALAAASQIANQPSGAAAWAWMETNVLTAPVLDGDPKWALLPRRSQTSPSPPRLL